MKGMLKEIIPEIRATGRVLRRAGSLLVFTLIAVYFLSGIYQIKAAQTGVKKRFGRVVNAAVMPGLHYRLPWPLESVEVVSTSEVRRLQAGFGAAPEDVRRFQEEASWTDANAMQTLYVPYCLSSDKNIVHLKVMAQYRISEPVRYLFDVNEAEKLLAYCLQNAILMEVAKLKVDIVLTTGRYALQSGILTSVRERMEVLGCGLYLVSVEVAKIRPPSDTEQAFKEVVSAQEERMTIVHAAETYRNEELPQARAEAARMLAEAEAYRKRKVAHAEGESGKFISLLTEYNKNKRRFEERITMDALSGILGGAKLYIIGEHDGKKAADFKLLIGDTK